MKSATSGAGASETASATDEVIGAITDIEMKRRSAEKEAGLAAACTAALRKLHELLDREREAKQRVPEPGHPLNVEAVTAEIERVKALAAVNKQRPASQGAYALPQKVSWKNNARSPARNKGRRTMGRAGGR